jgi:hypothetical protein
VWIKALIFVFAIECFCLWGRAVHRLDAEFASSGSGNLRAIDFERRTARIRALNGDTSAIV